ncbi:GNAT family N-acetyltransferase [Pengzhenrongella frigida]|uniref:GNAT family N-acetyltransferase n=1 Tax=Pengzhenrongella frigida TaxID=1259133 RepID=A0A4Q5N789_9MICO|nr:GNAT family N-acetyltransferase [Cellulomonas sp. HLT2-17]RYV52311.1 GNAT family N-acetyltransferase [Cellulomonas sp. HLT2-17]
MSDPAGTIQVVPSSRVPWKDVRVVFGTRGDPASCWCQYFKVTNREWNQAPAADRERALCAQVEREPAPGVVGYLDGEPVGWCGVESRTHYPRLLTATVVRGSAEPADDGSVWAVTCFVVRVGFRRRGIATALLDGAVDHARRSGARIIEAYPVDTSERKASAADLYHGSLALYERAGFRVVSRPVPGRAVVALD